ncbi:bifunctional phosphatidyl-N-methylethanolamine N-methyltransferase/phosphatidyl-N-dimethylethanolamine N-methyltransferase [Cyberlindnera jadinii NRRL Y-1542]|uniref:Phosphatidyl-N-methylethanolamine N-methyltransferase n=1 Tax=Cyberlindnera jadinii (strain ATCC 18201 / CBS 1600 / BCRC 20928 / JCM 3617 / NBRC 0987 / NRRL Y-1542) TaxID=983966 RepID=A0A1E4S1H4_CYBJN|nr:phospholipid methyltransferase [Cyberlindnera jadinii NRRL Y-1542]ODV73328.1 phospholipid methyltransferase [Cyberlindnera jadinii NRRL Y-1542]
MSSKIDQALDVFNQLCTEVDITSKSFQIALASICFNPVFWNVVARLEYNTHFLTKLSGGPKNGCYLLAFTIFSLGIFRDYLYERALKEQVTSDLLTGPIFTYAGYFFFALGNIFVLSSMWALGVTGTYLGDYFGILMDHRVTGFPFNVLDNPMYVGSTLCFLGTALYFGKPAGLFATLFVHLLYSVALKFEEPFTAEIYAKKAREEKKKAT